LCHDLVQKILGLRGPVTPVTPRVPDYLSIPELPMAANAASGD
jgi:hypothetical protein